MRKRYSLLTIATVVAASAMAAQSPRVTQSVIDRIAKVAPAGQLVKSQSGKAATDLPTTLITETPEGTLYAGYYESATGYFPYDYGYYYENESDGNAIDLVQNGSKFYIKNPFSMNITNSWLEGNIKKADNATDPDTVLVQLPQRVGSYTYAYNIEVGSTGYGTSYKLSDNQQARYTWDGNTLTKLGDQVVGETDSNGIWDGYGDHKMVATKQTDVPTALPESATITKMAFKATRTYLGTKVWEIRVGRDGNDVYLGDIAQDQEFWIKGTINGNKVEILPQYLGIDKVSYVHKYFEPLTVTSTYDPDWGEYEETATFLDKFEYDYDAATGRMTSKMKFTHNPGKNVPNTNNVYSDTEVNPYAAGATVPASPEITYLGAFDQELGYARLVFDVKPAAADGSSYLDPAKLYYKVFLEKDKPFTFTPAEYKQLTADMTEVPYTYGDYTDIFANDVSRSIRIYHEVSAFGVQTIYKGGDEAMSSPVVWYPAEPSGVEGIDAGKEVKSVSFTDLSGRQVSAPTAGFYVKTVRYTDGTVSSQKVVK